MIDKRVGKITMEGQEEFTLQVNGVSVATCKHPDQLASWAFGNGCTEVRHDYDMSLVPPWRAAHVKEVKP